MPFFGKIMNKIVNQPLMHQSEQIKMGVAERALLAHLVHWQGKGYSENYGSVL
jgi:hypothetical protein